MEITIPILASAITVGLILLAYLGAEFANREHEKEIRHSTEESHARRKADAPVHGH